MLELLQGLGQVAGEAEAAAMVELAHRDPQRLGAVLGEVPQLLCQGAGAAHVAIGLLQLLHEEVDHRGRVGARVPEGPEGLEGLGPGLPGAVEQRHPGPHHAREELRSGSSASGKRRASRRSARDCP